MTDKLVPVNLVARRLSLREVQELSEWPYADEPFYLAQVKRSLITDIPQLVTQRVGVAWGYFDMDLDQSEQLVGFGVIHMSGIYSDLTDRKRHCYIPLLSVRPQIKSKGYGGLIIEHLVGEAARTVAHENRNEQRVSPLLFLDVYVKNEKAVARYLNSGFHLITSTPVPDPDENDELFHVMAIPLI